MFFGWCVFVCVLECMCFGRYVFVCLKCMFCVFMFFRASMLFISTVMRYVFQITKTAGDPVSYTHGSYKTSCKALVIWSQCTVDNSCGDNRQFLQLGRP